MVGRVRRRVARGSLRYGLGRKPISDLQFECILKDKTLWLR